MAPAPMMASLFGWVGRVIASRLVMTRLPSKATPGMGVGLAPTAMMTWSAVTSLPLTRTLCGPSSVAVPTSLLTPCLLNRLPMPLDSLSAMPRLRPITLGKSSLKLSKLTPWAAASVRILRMKLPSSSRALVGMQPQFRHVPPRFSCSTQRTFFLSCPARMAAAYPAGPPPMTSRS